MKSIIYIYIFSLALGTQMMATDYHVGPGQPYLEINDIPWETMAPGDNVYIHYRDSADGGPYKSKWVVNVPGTQALPFKVIGVSGQGGQRPVIDGNDATTRLQLNYWNEERSVIKVGGSSIPADGMPSFIVIENLEIRSGHNAYNFTDDGGNINTYALNAAAIHVEKVNNLIIRNCVIHDSGNGIFVSSNSNDITLEYNYIYGNGNSGRFFEHNTYTEATNITYQFNRFGPLRAGADGNNLKDRSAGLIVRYNWIEGGNRLLDLVDSGTTAILNNPLYQKTYVYGNIMIEEDGGNSQVMHYGGDSGITSQYRKGKLYFYNNTLYSIRAGNTTLARLSTNDETADMRNNILHVTSNGSSFALLDDSGQIDIYNNLIKSGWVSSHQGAAFTGTVQDNGSSVEVDDPGFIDAINYDFSLLSTSLAINSGTGLHTDASSYPVDMEYVNHQAGQLKPLTGDMDIGGYEYSGTVPVILSKPFKASLSGKSVRLTWSTALEYQVDHFLIKRMDDPIRNNWIIYPSGGQSDYNQIDRDLPKASITYQLWEVSLDGNKVLIGSDNIRITDQNLILVSNLVEDHLILSFPQFMEDSDWQIINLNGQRIKAGNLNDREILVSDLASGKYFFFVNGQPPISFIKL